MSYMKVYRVEDAEGEGIFQTVILDSPRLRSMYCSATHYPCPRDDEGIQRHMDYWERCGVASPEMLRYWFLPAFPLLRQAQAKIVIYIVPIPSVTVGEKQVLFDSRHARKLTELPIVDLPRLDEYNTFAYDVGDYYV